MHFNSVIIIILAELTPLSFGRFYYCEISFVRKSQWVHMSTLPPLPQEGSQGPPKMVIFEIRKCTKMAKMIYLRVECCQKYALYRKRLQIKVPEHSISYKKVSGRICLSPARGELGGQMAIFEIRKCTKMAKLIHFRAKRCQKIRIMSQISSYKSC